MAIFPPSTNSQYRGAAISAWFLMLASLGEIVPGLIHYFLPDGGAGVIAHLDLTTRKDTIISLFAWFGALQIPAGLMLFIIGLRYRTLVPLGLLCIIVSRSLMSIDGWFGKAAVGGHHPPEHFASPVAVALAAIFLILALRERSPGGASHTT